MPSLQTNPKTPSNTSKKTGPALPRHTTEVNDYGLREGHAPNYTYEEVQPHPVRFVSTVTLNGLRVEGAPRSSQKSAKHEASKALLEKLKLYSGIDDD